MMDLASPSNSLTNSLPFTVLSEVTRTEYTKACFALKVPFHSCHHSQGHDQGQQHHRGLVP